MTEKMNDKNSRRLNKVIAMSGIASRRKADELIESFDNELEKRSIFQYESTDEIKRAKAKTSLERAKNFINEMEKLLLEKIT